MAFRGEDYKSSFRDDDDDLDAEATSVEALAQTTTPRVVVFGRSGAGKSSLLNQIVGGFSKDPQPFPSSSDGDACTRTTAIKLRRFRGPFDMCCRRGVIPPKLIVMDAPGFSDGGDRDSDIMVDVVTKMKSLGHVNLFLLVVNAADPRLTQDMKNMLRQIVASCTKEALINSLVVYTHWARDKAARRARRRSMRGGANVPADFMQLPLEVADRLLQDSKHRQLTEWVAEEFAMPEGFDMQCVFVDNMFDEELLAEESKEDRAHCEEVALEFDNMKRLVFHRAVPIDARNFQAVRSHTDRLADARDEANQRAEQEAQRAEQEAQRAATASQQARAAEAQQRQEAQRRAAAEAQARQQRQQADQQRQQADQQRRAAEEARARMRAAEQREAQERQRAEEERRRRQAVDQFVGLLVRIGNAQASLAKMDRLLQPSTTVARVKQLLVERGHSNSSQAGQMTLMYNNTAMSVERTLSHYGMTGGNDYELTGIMERHGGMNQDTRRFLRNSAAKSITYRNTMSGIPEIRQCTRCKMLIKHVAACKHMTCGWCGHQFCFACLRDWSACGYAECFVAPRQA